MRSKLLLSVREPTLVALLLVQQSGAHAADVAPASKSSAGEVFTLGQITVTSGVEDEAAIGTTSVGAEQLHDLDKAGLADALNLIPGVASTAGSGSRNETLISVRGFDRWQVPLLLDGIRLYLPADNRIDFDRFLTPDLSEIQVSKGYVSVLNGPDGMGGAINLVTRKPTQALEGEVRSSLALANNGQINGNTSYGSLGSRRDKFYFQLGAEQRDVNRWRVSEGFSPTRAEDGGDRDHSDKKDKRVNAKFGLTPNAQDEYSLNFVKQEGEKHGVGAVTGTSTISTRDWPKWDTWSAYWLSHTAIGEKSQVETKAYYNKFQNDLVAYTNVSLAARSWTSHYNDYAEGLGLEFSTDLLPRQTLKTAANFRRDHHTEWQVTDTTGFSEPDQVTSEDVFSLAIEDTFHLSKTLDLTAAISRDKRRTSEAQEYANSVLFDQPRADSQATNYQAAAIYRLNDVSKLHASVSERTRFPTMLERFSSRFGGAISNPGLKPERARNLEIGAEMRLAAGLKGELNLFHSEVKDSIQSVSIRYSGATYSQSQNVGKASFQGVELSLTGEASPQLIYSTSYSYINTKLTNPSDPAARLTTTPLHKALAYLKWSPADALSIIPSVSYASSRWSTAAVGTGYVKTSDYALLGVKVEYRLSPGWDVSLSGHNLMDSNYQEADGYPQQGRNFLLATRYRF